jgi:hypothetical protein
VEEWKAALTRKSEELHNVDWLTEAIRRFSHAHLINRGWSTVDMSVPTRAEKVMITFSLSWIKPYLVIPLRSGRKGKSGTQTENGLPKRSQPLKTASLFMVQNSGRYTTKFAHGRCLRLSVSTATGKSNCPLSRYGFISHDSAYSSKLKQENIRARERAATIKGDEDEEPTFDAPMSDDEGSIGRAQSKANSSCGACRTRDSETWWRAPKGLATDILCDPCGTNWRKYADLNVRPIREDFLPTGKKVVEKREGTPLNGPSAKRMKV